MGKFRKAYRKKQQIGKVGKHYRKIGTFLVQVLALLLGYGCNLIFARILRYLVSPDEALLFGREMDVVGLMFFSILLLYLFDFISAWGTKKFPARVFLGVTLPILFVLATVYYYATDNGFYYRRLWEGHFVPWNQVKRVEIEISGGKTTNLIYRIITDNDRKVDINSGICNGDLTKLDQLLMSKGIRFRIEEVKNENHVERLSETESAVWANH